MSHADLEPFELLQKAADFFERIGAQYRIVGSMASMAYSEPRFTNDIDILVDLRVNQVEEIEREFPAPDFYVSPDAVKAAIVDRRQFNIIHVSSGMKLDVIQCKATEFGALDISMGKRLKSDGVYEAWFGAAENIILMKLRYYQEGGSEKHLRDISSILKVQGASIDRLYIEHWARRLGVISEWTMVCEQTN